MIYQTVTVTPRLVDPVIRADAKVVAERIVTEVYHDIDGGTFWEDDGDYDGGSFWERGTQ